jgi:hypothetical protein
MAWPRALVLDDLPGHRAYQAGYVPEMGSVGIDGHIFSDERDVVDPADGRI